ncbi:hypothetical protein [Methylobacterium nodulans]|uniref:Uncharacterized protein n=1 Tax=Methylobacterium nodulans (strain LMG 21967 / CNCM I-2342 / ORS 2060) TaxID=460265 RepID=B8IP11_METNO|nr:hypothetical protein [Methylobacterium nodulans]ACL60329.1 conserved hypothetical protein [Methylobacterium nodulans ORS 2060]
MNLEEPVRKAILAELERQAASGRLTLDKSGSGPIRLDGRIDVDELVMAVLGALAGGP